MNPLFRIDFSISDSLKIVRKSVLIYETIIRGRIYTFQISHQWLEFLVGNKFCGIPDLMYDTLLELGIRENSLNCRRETCQTVYTCDKEIFHATVLQTV